MFYSWSTQTVHPKYFCNYSRQLLIIITPVYFILSINLWICWPDYAWHEFKNLFKPFSAPRCFVRYGGETKSDHQMLLMHAVLKASSNEPLLNVLTYLICGFHRDENNSLASKFICVYLFCLFIYVIFSSQQAELIKLVIINPTHLTESHDWSISLLFKVPLLCHF